MTTLTTAQRAAATALAALFATGTGYVLLEDVLRHGAPIQVSHVLTLLALVGTIAAGHYLWIEARGRHLVSALGCALLFAAGTAYIVTASGARNAEALAAKAAAVSQTNVARGDVAKRIGEHEYALAACPDGVAKADRGVRCGLRDAMVAECASGKKGRCEGKTYSVELYESALRGLRADLARLGPEAEAHAGYAHAARVLAALPGVTADAEALAQRLVLLMPFLVVLIAEIGTLVFGHIALRSRMAPRDPAGSRNASRDAPTEADRAQTDFSGLAPASLFCGEIPEPPSGPGPGARQHIATGRRKSLVARSDSRSASRPDRAVVVPFARPSTTQRDAVLTAITAELAAGRAYPSQRDLCQRFGVARSTMSDWLAAWEAAGAIPPRRITGRTKRLASL